MHKHLFIAAAMFAASCTEKPAPETPGDAPAATAPPAQYVASAASDDGEIAAAGEVFWTPGEPLPAEAFLRVRLQDVSRADASAVTLAEQTIPIVGEPPATFGLSTKDDVDTAARLTVSAQITDGVALYFTTDANTPVSPIDGADNLRIKLVAVEGAAGTGAGGGAVTPLPVRYRCGGEKFDIAIEAGAAYVAEEGNPPQKLEKLGGGDAAPQTFTNGVLTLFFDGADMDGLNLRLARGKATAALCETAQ